MNTYESYTAFKTVVFNTCESELKESLPREQKNQLMSKASAVCLYINVVKLQTSVRRLYREEQLIILFISIHCRIVVGF